MQNNTTPCSSLAVYDGRTRLGHLVRHGDNFEAVDLDDVSHGIFHDMKSAAFALPAKGRDA